MQPAIHAIHHGATQILLDQADRTTIQGVVNVQRIAQSQLHGSALWASGPERERRMQGAMGLHPSRLALRTFIDAGVSQAFEERAVLANKRVFLTDGAPEQFRSPNLPICHGSPKMFQPPRDSLYPINCYVNVARYRIVLFKVVAVALQASIANALIGWRCRCRVSSIGVVFLIDQRLIPKKSGWLL